MKVGIEEVEAVTMAALERHGASRTVAATMADAVAWAEARGNRICGLYYVESYCAQLASGRVRGDVEADVERPRPGHVRVDARDGFAQPAFRAALPEAAAAARANGVALVTIGQAHTCTALGWFTEGAAARGLIALGMTNASPIVAPPGGSRRVIGTNPLAFAAPDGAGGMGLAFDQSTTQVALGRITMAKAAGETIPEGWAVDSEGRPTTDPGAALAGSLVSAGGHKGWGIGAMVEVLVAGLCGSRLSRDVKPLKAPEGEPHGLGQVFVLIDPGVSDVFADRLRALAEEVALDGAGRLPGRGRASQEEAEVPEALWATITGLAG